MVAASYSLAPSASVQDVGNRIRDGSETSVSPGLLSTRSKSPGSGVPLASIRGCRVSGWSSTNARQVAALQARLSELVGRRNQLKPRSYFGADLLM